MLEKTALVIASLKNTWETKLYATRFVSGLRTRTRKWTWGVRLLYQPG